MDTIHSIIFGFGVALTPTNLLYCAVGALLGTVIGVLPGMSPVIVVSMLLPLTFKIPAVPSIIMLAGIYYGSHHSGATCAVMLNMPGEPSSVVIVMDGHAMARQGRAGPALSIAAISSFFAGCVSILVIAFFSPAIARAALQFQAPEYASVVLLALVGASALSTTSIFKTLGMAALGLLLGTVGTDLSTGVTRFTFADPLLDDGIGFVAVAVGLFAVSEIAHRLGAPEARGRIDEKIRGVVPRSDDLKASWKPILRGTALGGMLGILPGTGPLISAFASYALEKRLAKDPTRFGRGAIEGVAGPEAADNAAALTHFIPMLTFGIPAGATFALLLGALLVQGIDPGPLMITAHADLFWGLIASMWIGNLMLLVFNLPLVGVWIRVLQTPYRFIYPMILLFSCIGVYSIRNEPFDVIVAGVTGAAGYLLRKLDCPPAPLILGLILGPLEEENLRRSLLLSRGDPSVFVTRPISLCILLLTASLLIVLCSSGVRRKGDRTVTRRKEML
ncbi:MAG TPA: tripartite tricarboxylate transporter permease [Acetobacteraceae bacterium]|nr:tripartite tricarboxylate transporter permease [Acetobacteraceae bacterium]